jgi:hypothetical protein
MTRKAILDFGADTAAITGAFFTRNALVLSALVVALLAAFAR